MICGRGYVFWGHPIAANRHWPTLADAIARARDVPLIHLDQLYHRPQTDWIPRPAEEFAALHDTATNGARWVIEGNYSKLLMRRLEKATGVILIDTPIMVSLYRYLRRCWFERDRLGGLAGARDRVTWAMLHHIAVVNRMKRLQYRTMLDNLALPNVLLNSGNALKTFYRINGLPR